MPWPEPEPGLVIRYAYLWRREQETGREKGTKDRPCAVVLALMDIEERALASLCDDLTGAQC